MRPRAAICTGRGAAPPSRRARSRRSGLGGRPRVRAAATERREKEVREQLAQALTPEEHERVDVRPAVEFGSPAAQIVAYVQRHDIDLIVIGTHGISGFQRVMLGSVTERVLRTAPSPVLAVPRRVSDTFTVPQALRTILCGVDFSDASLRAVEHASALSARAGARLILVNVFEWFAEEEPLTSAHFNVSEFRHTVEKEASERLAALAGRAGATLPTPPEIVLAYGKAHRELLRVATERSANLIVLGAHGRRAFDRVLFGSTPQHVVRNAACPVLIVPANARAAAAAA